MLSTVLSRLNDLLQNSFGELGPLFGLGGLGALLVLVALSALLSRRQNPMDRLKSQTHSPLPPHADSRPLRISGKDERLDRFAQYLEPQDQSEFSAAQLRLVRAGYRSKGAVQTFNFAQFALGLGGLALGTIYALLGPSVSAQTSAMIALGPGVIGYLLPKYWVQRRIQTREEEITAGFPDSLDLMLVCVEAGQSLDQAIIRVATEIRSSYPALAEEFEIVAYEMKAGKDKTKVLRDLGERVGVQDINSFVTTLIQSATFGTSIAEALRVYAEEMRDKRVMRAEEKANKLPTKLTLGTMLFCLPPLLIILIGPSIYGIAQNLSGG